MRGVHLTQAPQQLFVRRTADSTAKTDNTLAADDTLKWSVGANETWSFKAFLVWVGANATHDAKVGWTVPSGTTMQWGTLGSSASGQVGFGSSISAAADPGALKTDSQTLTTPTLAGSSGFAIMGLVVVSTTAGTVNLTWAQNTTDAGELKLGKNSYLELTKIG